MQGISKIIPAILGWITVIIVLSLAPTIATYNTAIATNVTAASNAAYMLGMTTVVTFGGFITIILLLLSTGMFAFAATKYSQNASIGDMLTVIGTVVVVLVVFSIYGGTLVGKFNDLITAGSVGFEKTVYGLFPIITYLGMIASQAGITGYKAYKTWKGGKSKKAAGAFI